MAGEDGQDLCSVSGVIEGVDCCLTDAWGGQGAGAATAGGGCCPTASGGQESWLTTVEREVVATGDSVERIQAATWACILW